MARRQQRLNLQELPRLPPPPLHGPESHVKKNRNSQPPRPITNRSPKSNRTDLVQVDRTDFHKYLLRPGPSTRFILRSSLVRSSLTVASCRHFLHHNISWGLPVDSYRIIVCPSGVIVRDERFIRSDDSFPRERRGPGICSPLRVIFLHHALDAVLEENPGFVPPFPPLCTSKYLLLTKLFSKLAYRTVS